MKKKLLLFLVALAAVSVFIFFVGKSPLISLITVGALADSVNPCAFSVLLLTIGFLFSMEMSRLKVLKIGLVYVIGIFLTYILIGLGILEALSFFGIPRFVSKVAAVILIAAGLINIINKFFPAFPIKLKIPEASHERIAVLISKASAISAFFLGIFVALFEFPCTGGPYLVVLGLLHDKASYFKGFLYLIYYNLIFVLPLVIILLVASNKILLERVRLWRKEEGGGMKLISGLVMILLGLIIFFII
ncbi:MAG: cytochrome c biogenesis protein CcdA [Candidatus Paceibacterota bacterium]